MNEMNRFLMAARAISAAPSADNSQPCRIERVGDEIEVSYRPHEGKDPFGVAGHGTLISVGAAAENLAQMCGLTTVVCGAGRWTARLTSGHGFPLRRSPVT